MSIDTLVVLDLEATCWNDALGNSGRTMETIEIAAIHATPDGKALSSFQTFIRPVINPVLSDFCTSLTGITQQDVNRAPGYEAAILAFDAWCAERDCAAWSSWGAYDKKQLFADSTYHKVLPLFFEKVHVNLKKPWKKTTKCKRDALRAALDFHGLKFEGTPHRAMDDTLNIVRLLPFIDKQTLNDAFSAALALKVGH